jgi:hypothetical protein
MGRLASGAIATFFRSGATTEKWPLVILVTDARSGRSDNGHS